MFFWVNFCYCVKIWIELLIFICLRNFVCGGLCIINIMFLFGEFIFWVLRLFGVIVLFFLIDVMCRFVFIYSVGFLLFIGVIIMGIDWVVLNLLFDMFRVKELWVFLFLLCWYMIEVDFLICVRENMDIGFVVFFCLFVIILWWGGVMMKNINLLRGLLLLIVFRIVMFMNFLFFLLIKKLWVKIWGFLLFCGIILILSKYFGEVLLLFEYEKVI